jgi:hypothetical protein
MKHSDPFFTEAKYVGALHEIGAAEPVWQDGKGDPIED